MTFSIKIILVLGGFKGYKNQFQTLLFFFASLFLDVVYSNLYPKESGIILFILNTIWYLNSILKSRMQLTVSINE